ncbi:Hypothetical_protein [Hexamita inflata]|uniref:Hypothetical_protein n=1 Tax=Hexamita inflata TaxID=28002 RepID=A0AA86QGD9_9EUKA|nr:Hypothetical protein HINF_LOCUS38785 [Hexamita inflata]
MYDFKHYFITLFKYLFIFVKYIIIYKLTNIAIITISLTKNTEIVEVSNFYSAQTDFIETFESKTQALARPYFHFQNGPVIYAHSVKTQQGIYIARNDKVSLKKVGIHTQIYSNLNMSKSDIVIIMLIYTDIFEYFK